MFTPTLQDISSWGGPYLLKEAEALLKAHAFANVRFADGTASADVVWGGATIRTGFTLHRNNPRIIDSHCRCAANRRDGRICTHVVGLGMLLFFREHDPELKKNLDNEKRHALALEEAESQGALLGRADAEHGGTPAEVRIRLPRNWGELFWDERESIRVQCLVSIAGASAVPIDKVGRDLKLDLVGGTEDVLFFLEDVCGGAPGGEVELTPADFVDLIGLHRSHHLKIYRSGGVPLVVEPDKLPVPVSLDLDRENGELMLFAHPIPPGEVEPDPLAIVVAHKRMGWVCSRDRLWQIQKTLPPEFQDVYHETRIIPRRDIVRFLRHDAPKFRDLCDFSEEISLDLFEMTPAEPEFSVRLRGSPASVTATLHALYDGGAQDVVACADSDAGDFALPDPDNIFRYRTRNPEAEHQALARLGRMGFMGNNGGALSTVVGVREVLNILGGRVPEMRRLGWKVAFDGSLAEFADGAKTATATVRISAENGGARDNSAENGGAQNNAAENGGAQNGAAPGAAPAAPQGAGLDWFEVGFDVATPDGAVLSPEEVRRAIAHGESFVRHGDDVVLLDTAGIAAAEKALRGCGAAPGSSPGSLRLGGVHAAFVEASLADAGDLLRVEAPPVWRDAAARQNRTGRPEIVSLGEPLDGILRPYQKEGVSWLRFLEESRAGGILADEMGLGKTLQTLAWLQMERFDPALRGRPALIVAPTSLVRNWEHEALKFTPHLKPLVMSGADRHTHWPDIPAAPLVITSYALLRRDIERYAAIPFACAVLDEAQNIKNRTTQNATAVKQLQAAHRLVLTGTPVENGPADLWSIMDFLMPGYLGEYDEFQGDFEMPLKLIGEPECEDAQKRLRRKLRPFLLRRRKKDVAKDLPDKIVEVSYCELGDDQKVVYKALLDRTRSSVSGMVAADGFGKSRMKVLAELMRLRQACCHLGLLASDPELKRIADKAASPSAKTDQFLELLDEAVAGGHRILVFSQFTTMLGLLKERLEAEAVRYCYLDGSTKDRLVVCQTFNSDPSIPVFLISLKAGGTGLNLTGADMVVHFDPWWNPAAEDQATDRAHRIGQKNTVHCIKLIAQGTIEEKVLELQEHKRALIAATVEGGGAAESVDDVSWDDVKGLLDIAG